MKDKLDYAPQAPMKPQNNDNSKWIIRDLNTVTTKKLGDDK